VEGGRRSKLPRSSKQIQQQGVQLLWRPFLRFTSSTSPLTMRRCFLHTKQRSTLHRWQLHGAKLMLRHFFLKKGSVHSSQNFPSQSAQTFGKSPSLVQPVHLPYITSSHITRTTQQR